MKRNLIVLTALLITAALIRHLIPNPCQTPLYQNALQSRDRNQIFEYCEANEIPYEWSPERQQILVQNEQAQALRRTFFYEGLPTEVTRRSLISSPLGLTETEQRVVHQKLLEQEITDLLRSLPNIVDALVRIAYTDRACYPAPEGVKTTARVYILHYEPVDPAIWPNLEHYIQMVSPNPKFDGIVVLDSRGVVLYDGESEPAKHSDDKNAPAK